MSNDRVVLNQDLVEQQRLPSDTLEKIVEVHEMMDEVLDSPEDYSDPVYLVEMYETWLQELWGFPQDRNYHVHWVRIKGCACPKWDNRLLAGLDARYISTQCPWHSKQYKGEEK